MNKKLIGICIVLFIQPAFITAQNLFEKIDFGVKSSLNFCTIGTNYEKYNGNGGFSLGMFGSYKYNSKNNITIEPLYTTTSFCERQIDAYYQYSLLDFNINHSFGFWEDNVIQFYTGIRPSMLLQFDSKKIISGNYIPFESPINTNKTTQLDLGINAGIAIKLSPVVSFELGYTYSISDQNNNSTIKGRPSTLEATIKLSAVDIKKYFDNRELVAKAKIKALKNGSLFVMLPTLSEKELSRLNETSKAKAQADLLLMNKNTILAFTNHFNFSKTYFFMDSSINKILTGSFNNVFVNADLQIDTTIQIASENFFIASFCNDLYAFNQQINFGLFVYDDKFNQLGKPYTAPSQMFGIFNDEDPLNYFRTRKIYTSKLSFAKMVKKLNNRLLRYAEGD